MPKLFLAIDCKSHQEAIERLCSIAWVGHLKPTDGVCIGVQVGVGDCAGGYLRVGKVLPDGAPNEYPVAELQVLAEDLDAYLEGASWAGDALETLREGKAIMLYPPTSQMVEAFQRAQAELASDRANDPPGTSEGFIQEGELPSAVDVEYIVDQEETP